MAERKLFGTDGIRGIANQYPMTCEMALALGRAVAHQCKEGNHRHKIIVGKDTRLSCYMLEMAFASGVCSMGVDAILTGPLPTPAVAYLTQSMRADAGVIISASHNPYQDNGIKIFARDGFKLPDAKEATLEAAMKDETIESIRPTKDAVGKAFRIDDAKGRYITHVKNAFPKELDLSGLRLVVDCANGSAYKVAPTIFYELGAEVFPLGIQPNGRNINDGCGALYPENVAEAVRVHRADGGIALDGDADRLIVIDENGDVISGDAIMAVSAEDRLSGGQLPNNTLVATVMSNLALDRFMETLGGRVLRTQVGDRYVVEAMRNQNLVLGGENSGHIIHLDSGTTGDGILAALKFLAVARRSGARLSELRQRLVPFPQALLSVRVKEKPPLENLEEFQNALGKAERRLGKDGRVMVRYSGTEPKARVLVEGPNADDVHQIAEGVASALRRSVGA